MTVRREEGQPVDLFPTRLIGGPLDGVTLPMLPEHFMDEQMFWNGESYAIPGHPSLGGDDDV
jgi:hypothetical protein